MRSQTLNPKPTKRTPAEEVNSFIAALEHPLKAEVLALRQIILEADPSIFEGIKWNVPSFYTSEYFATFYLLPSRPGPRGNHPSPRGEEA